MKVLFLNPHVRDDHPLVKGLQARGLAVLVAANAREATQMLMLHGSNIDLAIVHREDESNKDNEGGFRFVAKIKSSAAHADLPMIISSQRWSDSEFARHQESPQGANAYLKWPFDVPTIYSLIGAVFGGAVPSSDASRTVARQDLEAAISAALPPSQPSASSRSSISLGTGGSGGLVLEDASSLFSRTDQKSIGDTSIRLEMPDTEMPTGITSAATGVVVHQAAPATNTVDTNVGIELPTAQGEAPGMLVQDASVEALLDAPVGGEDSAPADVVNDGLTTVGIPTEFATNVSNEAVNDGLTTVGMPSPEDLAAVNDGLTTVGMPTVADGSEISFDIHDGRTTVGLPEGLLESLSAGREAVVAATTVTESPEAEEYSLDATIAEQTQQAAPQPAPQGDAEAAQQMPYLYPEGHGRPAAAAVAFALPVGDAVVPGGAANAPDVETLKKYLLLREQDVAVLSNQLKAARDQIKSMDDQLRVERARNTEMGHVTFEQRRKLEEFEKEKQHALEAVQAEVNEVRFQFKAKADKARVFEAQVRESHEEIERLKERVRTDIRKIRVREKELENRLEIVKKDSEALISARENKIIELKRKLDLLEFNMDLLQDQHSREKEAAAKLRERLAKAAQVVRVAGGLLDNPAGASQLAAVLAGDVDAELSPSSSAGSRISSRKPGDAA